MSTFLQAVMGLDLPPEAIATLQNRTEGWIAGLQLAALSLQGRADLSHGPCWLYLACQEFLTGVKPEPQKFFGGYTFYGNNRCYRDFFLALRRAFPRRASPMPAPPLDIYLTFR